MLAIFFIFVLFFFCMFWFTLYHSSGECGLRAKEGHVQYCAPRRIYQVVINEYVIFSFIVFKRWFFRLKTAWKLLIICYYHSIGNKRFNYFNLEVIEANLINVFYCISFRDHADYGFDVTLNSFNWGFYYFVVPLIAFLFSTIKESRDAYIRRLNGIYETNLKNVIFLICG